MKNFKEYLEEEKVPAIVTNLLKLSNEKLEEYEEYKGFHIISVKRKGAPVYITDGSKQITIVPKWNDAYTYINSFRKG